MDIPTGDVDVDVSAKSRKRLYRMRDMLKLFNMWEPLTDPDLLQHRITYLGIRNTVVPTIDSERYSDTRYYDYKGVVGIGIALGLLELGVSRLKIKEIVDAYRSGKVKVTRSGYLNYNSQGIVDLKIAVDEIKMKIYAYNSEV